MGMFDVRFMIFDLTVEQSGKPKVESGEGMFWQVGCRLGDESGQNCGGWCFYGSVWWVRFGTNC